MYCAKCGNPLEAGATFCGECGTKVELSEMNNMNQDSNGQSVSDHMMQGNVQLSNQPIVNAAQRKSGFGSVVAVLLCLCVALAGTIIFLLQRDIAHEDSDKYISVTKDDGELTVDNIYSDGDKIQDVPQNKDFNMGAAESEATYDIDGTSVDALHDILTEEYLFPSDSVYITVEYLATLTRGEIGLVRNEIYARHGYVFNTAEYSNYFKDKSWYEPDPNFDASSLSDIEIANVNTILAYEKQMGWR